MDPTIPHKLVLLYVIFVCYLAGCKKESTTIVEPIPSPEIVPLEVGNKWIRSFELYDTSGNVFSSGVDSIIVVRDTSILRLRWFILKLQASEYLVSNQPGGLWWRSGQYQSIWYQYPAERGDSFFVYGNTSFVRVSAVDTLITVAAGSFSCYRYEYDIPPSVGAIGGSRVVEFLSPNTGYVKYEYYQSTFTSQTQFLYSRIQLTSLHLN